MKSTPRLFGMRNAEKPLGNLEEHMTQDARPSGAAIRQRVFGGSERPAAGTDPIRFWRRSSRPPSSMSGVECGIGPVWS